MYLLFVYSFYNSILLCDYNNNYSIEYSFHSLILLLNVITIISIDKFYHLAALVKFNFELADELFQINYTGTQHAIELAKKLNSKHFLYVSTAYTIGEKELAYEELHPVDTPTNNPYEASKVQAEHLVAQEKDMATSIIRPAIIIGDSVTGEADSKFTLYGFPGH